MLVALTITTIHTFRPFAIFNASVIAAICFYELIKFISDIVVLTCLGAVLLDFDIHEKLTILPWDHISAVCTFFRISFVLRLSKPHSYPQPQTLIHNLWLLSPTLGSYPQPQDLIPNLGLLSPTSDSYPQPQDLIPNIGLLSPTSDSYPQPLALIPNLELLSPTLDSYPQPRTLIPNLRLLSPTSDSYPQPQTIIHLSPTLGSYPQP
ncbi:hypothetical protein EGW08_005964 [Elysia chlorotica]|uniref:Uncharacterized protein n=1 Tax=Elysia chlorotica TaxID=188477 RepID=A0A3S1A9R5_ELYCH|nr:hypothetical protein EGW08_005964 [Elysia chlorotica]